MNPFQINRKRLYFPAILVFWFVLLLTSPFSAGANNLKYQNYVGLGGDFELLDQNGRPFRLSDHKDKLKLLFFGYTRCTDVCPVTLKSMLKVKENLGPLADKMLFIFISIDPKRDSARDLKRFMAKYDPTFKGLWGTEGQIARVASLYSVRYFEIDKISPAKYRIDHTPFSFLVDQKGILLKIFPYNTKQEIVTAFIEQALKP